MSRTISTRLPEQAIEELERIADERHLDRSALIRKMLLEDIEGYRMEQATGEAISASRRPERAGVSLWRFVDEGIRENVRPPTAGREQLQRELAESLETWSEG